MDILRFITAGNVDDGKSTLIGRLLYDTNNIKKDLLQAVSNDKADNYNLAYITDGLRSEREQGITIDVAYKYFTTKNRKYIITDAPGHFQYTKNLVTGASNVDLIIILIDAQNGITEQTKRHSLVASFLQIKHVVVAVNKMDAVNYDEQIFNSIQQEFSSIAEKLSIQNLTFIPISALQGDNVSFPSASMKWYDGTTLENYLENCSPSILNTDTVRFAVQCIISGENIGYAGQVISGSIKVNDTICIHPGNHLGTITRIVNGYNEVASAEAGQNICIYLHSDYKPQRGDLISNLENFPVVTNQIDATICWFDETPLQIEKDYILRLYTTETLCRITKVDYKVDVNSFEKNVVTEPVKVNEFARVSIKTKDAIAYDTFASIPECGRGVLIDPVTNNTAGAYIIN